MTSATPAAPSTLADIATADLLPTARAMNGPVVLHPRDWISGTMLVGGQGSGKSSVLLRQYLNALRDPLASVIVIDPKTSFARRCLALTAQRFGKRVWYLELGRPAFGMSPLRMDASWQAITDLVVEAMRDVLGDQQIFQASRSVIERCVLGALSLAAVREDFPRVENVRALMVPEADRLRAEVIDATNQFPNLELVRDYFRVELAGDLAGNQANTRQRLSAPRNKLDALLTAHSLAVFFNHTTEHPLQRIVADRDVLIVNADLGEAGDENSRLVISFILRMLDVVLKQQMARESGERSRVHLLIDEAGRVINETLIDMLASHREAGLTVTLALQYFAQLQEEKVLKGVLNLCASHCLFRVSEPRDAELASDIARAVLTSHTLADPDARGRMRVPPEALMNLLRWHCLCSWVAHGCRAAAFIGRTYPMPEEPGWTEAHLDSQRAVVGPYPENLEQLRAAARQAREDGEPTARPAAGAERNAGLPAEGPDGASEPAAVGPKPATGGDAQGPAGGDPTAAQGGEAAPSGPAATKSQPMIERHPQVALIPESPARRVLGRAPVRGSTGREIPQEVLRDLAIADQVRSIDRPAAITRREGPIRIYDGDVLALKLLDRFGIMLPGQIARYCYGGASPSTVRGSLGKLSRAGLIERLELSLSGRRRGGRPAVYALSADGLALGKNPPGRRAAVISERRKFHRIESGRGLRVPHDLHTVEWTLALIKAFSTLITDNWRTPRYAGGRFQLPSLASGRGRRRPVTPGELPVGDHLTITGLPATDFADLWSSEGEPGDERRGQLELLPDAAIEVRVERARPPLLTDVLVETQRTLNAKALARKLRRYDAFLAGWCLAHRRYQTLATRPVAVFVAGDQQSALKLLHLADEAMAARIGVAGTSSPEGWYYPGRDHLFVAVETDLLAGSGAVYRLPRHPPSVRIALEGTSDFAAERVALLPQGLAGREPMPSSLG